jgi:peptidyl-prolyl cis-trans isomerase A (cyclophilin A)
MLCFYVGCAALLGLCMLSITEAVGDDSAEHPVVLFETTAGPITLELDRAKAPITVDNFLKYVDSGFFDGLIFHRVIPGFMIQGGGMNEQMQEKTQGALPPIRNEAKNGLSNQRGTISMARTSDPNSATSQFFISLVDNSRSLDPNPRSAGYAVFGKVTGGMETVDEIAKAPTGTKAGHEDVPLKPIFIKSARRKTKS